jgi:hypothetical protein
MAVRYEAVTPHGTFKRRSPGHTAQVYVVVNVWNAGKYVTMARVC